MPNLPKKTLQVPSKIPSRGVLFSSLEVTPSPPMWTRGTATTPCKLQIQSKGPAHSKHFCFFVCFYPRLIQVWSGSGQPLGQGLAWTAVRSEQPLSRKKRVGPQIQPPNANDASGFSGQPPNLQKFWEGCCLIWLWVKIILFFKMFRML